MVDVEREGVELGDLARRRDEAALPAGHGRGRQEVVDPGDAPGAARYALRETARVVVLAVLRSVRNLGLLEPGSLRRAFSRRPRSIMAGVGTRSSSAGSSKPRRARNSAHGFSPKTRMYPRQVRPFGPRTSSPFSMRRS